jgi:peptidyl-prolyl cis-trans isomerase SurA
MRLPMRTSVLTASLRSSIPLLLVLLAVLLVSSACNRSRPAGAEVMAEVNGRAIMAKELEQFYQNQVQEEPKKPAGEQEMMLRLNILQGLVEREIMLQQAEKQGLTATDAEVINKFTAMKSPYTEEEFQKKLQQTGLTVEQIKDQIRREESVTKLTNKEVSSKISITDGEIKQFYDDNRASFNVPETRFQLAQILVNPDPNGQVRNLKGDKARNEVEAKNKIEMLAGRLKNGEDFAQLAQSYSEDPATAQNGGELGYIPISSLDKSDPQLKTTVLEMLPGQVSKVIHSKDGYHILRLLSKEPGGQRQLSDPAVQQSIRSTLLGRKEQLLKAAYYEELRNQSKVVNYLSRRILEAAGKK